MNQDRRGVALGLVLWALVIASAVLTVAVFLGMQERRAAASGRRMQRAMTHAETGLADVLLGWTPGLLGRRILHPFDSLSIAAPGPGEPIWHGTIQRLNRGMFLVSVTAGDPAPPTIATITTLSRLGWLVRVRSVSVSLRAALDAGAVWLGEGSRVDGQDAPPAGGIDCPAPDSSLAGVGASSITLSGNVSVQGSPPIVRTGVDTGFPAGMNTVFDQLFAQATLALPGGSWTPTPVVAGGECDVSDPRNWGDPSDGGGACSDYWPVIAVSGDLRVLSGSGHGILLVDGDLVIEGSFRFSGVILVRGKLESGAIGVSVSLLGAVLAGQVGSEAAPLSGISVTYSKCMVSNSLQSSGALVPLRSRSWKQLF